MILGVPDGVVLAACTALDELRQGPRTKVALIDAADSSPPTMQRALKWLRDIGAPLAYDRVELVWVLADPAWEAPTWTLGRHGLYAFGQQTPPAPVEQTIPVEDVVHQPKLAPSVLEAKLLVKSLLLNGLPVPDEPNRRGRPGHRAIDVVYMGVLAAMTGRSLRRVQKIVTVKDMVGRVVKPGALSRLLRTPKVLTALAHLVHDSAGTAREAGCDPLDGSKDLDPMTLADELAVRVGPVEGSSLLPEGRASAILCRAIAYNMVAFGKVVAEDKARREAQARVLEELVFGHHFAERRLAYDHDELMRVRTAEALYDYARWWVASDERGLQSLVNGAVCGLFGLVWVGQRDVGDIIEAAISVHLKGCRMAADPNLVDDAELTEVLERVWLDLHGATGLPALTVKGHPNRSLVASIANAIEAIFDDPRRFNGLAADWTSREPRDPDAEDATTARPKVSQEPKTAPPLELAEQVPDDAPDPLDVVGPGRPPPTPAEPVEPQTVDVDDLPQVLFL